MTPDTESHLRATPLSDGLSYDEPVDRVEYQFNDQAPANSTATTRRQFMQLLGAGLLIAVYEGAYDSEAIAQEGGRRGGGGGGRGQSQPTTLGARLHIGQNGAITVLSGKVECGQGVRAQLTQAAAEELRISPDLINIVLADTDLTPNDGITAGSRSTPSTVPAIRQAAGAARDLLIGVACQSWGVQPTDVEVRDGKVSHAASGRSQSYADLAKADSTSQAFAKAIPPDVTIRPVKEWQVMGTSLLRPNRNDIVTGTHRFPSDIVRPNMLYGKVLRAPSYGATPGPVDVSKAQAMPGVQVVQDGNFVGVAAPTNFLAGRAIEAIAKATTWQTAPHPSSKILYDHLRQKVAGGIPQNPFAAEMAGAAKRLSAKYNVAYVQHAPMEPRAAVAEWTDGKLTVWTATQNPFGVRSELARAFGLPENQVRVIVPDFGGGFGGKHSGESAIEAARLAKSARRPVHLRWTREEEFKWAYFRPAAAIDIEAALDVNGTLSAWHYVNINSGNSAVETPYKVAKARSQFVQSEAPLRHGSYRALASTANTFARECFMDELAELAGKTPLEFRLAHLDNPRLRAVLEDAAQRCNWAARWPNKQEGSGIGLACGTEKGSFVAASAEVSINRENNTFTVRKIGMSYECGAIINPANLMAQVQGGLIMGLGPALREAMRWDEGRMQNASFTDYQVPRAADVPEMDIHLLNRPDLPSVGAGETPIIAVAPAIANAVYHALGRHVREMPIRL